MSVTQPDYGVKYGESIMVSRSTLVYDCKVLWFVEDLGNWLCAEV